MIIHINFSIQSIWIKLEFYSNTWNNRSTMWGDTLRLSHTHELELWVQDIPSKIFCKNTRDFEAKGGGTSCWKKLYWEADFNDNGKNMFYWFTGSSLWIEILSEMLNTVQKPRFNTEMVILQREKSCYRYTEMLNSAQRTAILIYQVSIGNS